MVSLSGCCAKETPKGVPPVSLFVAVCLHRHAAWGPPPSLSLHMTAQKTTSRWIYSPSFVHFQHRDTRQIMLNGGGWQRNGSFVAGAKCVPFLREQTKSLGQVGDFELHVEDRVQVSTYTLVQLTSLDKKLKRLMSSLLSNEDFEL